MDAKEFEAVNGNENGNETLSPEEQERKDAILTAMAQLIRGETVEIVLPADAFIANAALYGATRIAQEGHGGLNEDGTFTLVVPEHTRDAMDAAVAKEGLENAAELFRRRFKDVFGKWLVLVNGNEE